MSSELSAKPQPAEVNAMSVQSISSCYDAAETAIKQAEVLCQHQPIPALNEMRYAGYHALRYAELPAGDERDEERRKCVRHARRAYYDANEFMILGLCGEADAIDRKIRGYEHIVSEIMGHQSFSQFSGQLIAAREFAMESRLRQKDEEKWQNREILADQCAQHAKNIRAFLQAFDAHKIAIFSRISSEKKNSRNTWMIAFGSAIVGGLAVLTLWHLALWLIATFTKA